MSVGKGRSIQVYNSEGPQSSVLTRSSYPSGSTISLGTDASNGQMGVFKVYWGEDVQPSNSFLNSVAGVNSTWPHTFHIVWEPRELGTTATWPSQEFIVEVECQQSTVGGKPTYISDSGRSGVNPAAAIYQMLFELPPYGMGLDQNDYNMGDFTALAERFALDGPEPFPCSVYLSAGKSFKDGIIQVLEDTGVSWWFDKATGKNRFTAVRKVEEFTTVEAQDYSESDMDLIYDYATLEPTSTVYAFLDRNRAFARSTLRRSEDGLLRLGEGGPTATKVDLGTVTDYTTANMIASRRDQERTQQEEIPLTLSINYMDIDMGALYSITGLQGKYRVKSYEPDLLSYTAKVTFIRDVYSVDNDYSPVEESIIDQGLLDPEEDVVTLQEPTRIMAPDADGVVLFKRRAHNQITGSTLTISPDDTTYVRTLGSGTYSSGGTLSEALPDTLPLLIEEGPTINNVDPDILGVADLSGSESVWQSGSQMCLINGELFFLRNITALAEDSYRLEGLIRARLGTEVEDHAIGAQVFIFSKNAFALVNPSFLGAGADIYAKTLPASSKGSLQPDDVTAVSLTYQGGGFVPLAVTNLTTLNLSKYWFTGDDAEIIWSYRNKTNNSGAGVLRAGRTGVPDFPEATFVLQILDGVTIVREETLTDAASYTYTNANMVSDFGVEPSTFDVIVISALNGYVSAPKQITIDRY